MTTVATARQGRRGWLMAALAVASAVLLGSILAVGVWGLGPGPVGSGAGLIQDHRSEHYGPMMRSDPGAGNKSDRRSGGGGHMDGWGNS